MKKSDFMNGFWEKRWNKNSGYLFSKKFNSSDLINARIRYNSGMDRTTADCISRFFPKEIEEKMFWAAISSTKKEIVSGEWKKLIGRGQDLREHLLFDKLLSGSVSERIKAKEVLKSMGYRGEPDDRKVPTIPKLNNLYSIERKEEKNG